MPDARDTPPDGGAGPVPNFAALIDAPAAAALLGMSEAWVRRSAREGRLPCHRRGRRVKFDPAELAAWAARQHTDIDTIRPQEGP